VADPPLLQGCGVDDGLSSEGRRQAAQATNFLACQQISAVFSSPLRRAMETAETIARPHGLLVESLPDLKEVDVGRWEGRNWSEIARSEPDAYQRFMTDAATHGYPEGENHKQVLDRVEPAMKGLMAANLGRQIVVVAHNVVSRAYLAHVLGMPLSKARRVSHDNCGISVLRYREGEVRLLTLNSAFHLED